MKIFKNYAYFCVKELESWPGSWTIIPEPDPTSDPILLLPTDLQHITHLKVIKNQQ